MRVRFTLTMQDCSVAGKRYDQVVIDWLANVSEDEVLKLSQEWITSQNLLTNRMLGLKRVGESSLMIEPLENIVNTDSEL